MIKFDKSNIFNYLNAAKCHKTSCKAVNTIYMKYSEEQENDIKDEAKVNINNLKIDDRLHILHKQQT